MLAHSLQTRLQSCRPAGLKPRCAKRCVAPLRAAATEILAPLPRNVTQMADQAATTVKKAQEAGHKRQIVEFLNPVNEKAVNFLAIDAMDYPCSNMKEFESIINVTKAFMQNLLGDSVELKAKRIDEGGIDGDLCALVYPPDKSALALVWPTAEKLKQLKKLAEDPAIKLLMVVNPLWKTTGNLMSEFGFGPWRQANEEFVGTFLNSYALYEQRIGAPSSINMATGNRYDNGAVLRVLRSWPEEYAVHIVSADGSSQAAGKFPGKPSYNQLEEMVDKARKAKLEIFKVASAASNVFVENAGGDEQEEQSFYSVSEVMDMEPVKLRRVLISLGLPSAGSLQRLQQRLVAVAQAVEGGSTVEEAVNSARRLK